MRATRFLWRNEPVFTRHPELVAVGAPAFATLVQGDVAEFGRQQPDFAADPRGVMSKALDGIGVDERIRADYEQNLLPLVYGSFKPHFDEAFASFDEVARTLLRAAGRARSLALPR